MSSNLFSQTCRKTSRVRILVGGLAVTICFVFLPNTTQAVTCHCFRERTFEPTRPASADPYILATTRNSFLAAASGVDKGTVVRQRMTGASESDLWLSLYLSTLVDLSPEDLLEARDRNTTWGKAFEAMGLTTELGPAFQAARKKDDADGMARALAEQVLAKTFDTAQPSLDRMREKGAGIAESALSLYLAARLTRAPDHILAEVQRGQETWGSLLHSLGVPIETTGGLIAQAVRTRGN